MNVALPKQRCCTSARWLFGRRRSDRSIRMLAQVLAAWPPSINQKEVGPDHPDVAVSLDNLGELYRMQGRYMEAEPLEKRALAVREKALDPGNEAVAKSLNNLALLYNAQGRHAEAEPLYERSLA